MKPEKRMIAYMLVLQPDSQLSVLVSHSDPAFPPDHPEGGRRTGKSVVWAKVGNDEAATWRKTPYRSVHRAMDDLLNFQGSPEDCVELLVSGVRIEGAAT